MVIDVGWNLYRYTALARGKYFTARKGWGSPFHSLKRMPYAASQLGNFLAFSALLFAIVAGVVSGAFSCGGSVLHHQALLAALALSTLAAVAAPGSWLFSRQRRAAFLIGVPVTYAVMQAAAAPFYPASPSSAGQFLEVFLRTLESGPC